MSDDAIGPGGMLRTARESLEVTLREVADALNLPNQVIEAMETDDYANLPSAVFARGYLRSYARLLDLDEDAVVAHYPHGSDDTITTEVAVVNPAEEWVRQHPVWVLGSGGAVLVIVIAVLTIWLWENDDTVSSASASSAAVADQAVAELAADAHEADIEVNAPQATLGSTPRRVTAAARETPAANVPGAGVAGDVAGDVVANIAGNAAEEVTEGVARNDSATTAAAPLRGPTTGLAGQSDQRITAFGDDVLEFRFTEECWVEVKSNTGRNLYSDLSRAGQTLRLTGEGPFRILLGYAPGVQLGFNDEAVALGPHTRNNVANLVLGQ